MKKIKFVSDFKAFITKGNILDMAVGVIIGGAFGKIVSSLVADIIMPLVSALCNTKSLADMKYVITEAVPASEDGTVPAVAEVAVKYGNFIMLVIDFLIVALCMFLVIKLFMGMRNKVDNLKKKEEEAAAEEAPAAPAEPTVEEKTLATLNDIKALLEKNAK